MRGCCVHDALESLSIPDGMQTAIQNADGLEVTALHSTRGSVGLILQVAHGSQYCFPLFIGYVRLTVHDPGHSLGRDAGEACDVAH